MSSNDIYVTYLTTYFGSKMPMFYIGSTRLNKIQKGYRGTVSSKKYKTIWQSELKNNPHLFKTKVITYHKTREDAIRKEFLLQVNMNTVNSPMYINMSYPMLNGYVFIFNNVNKNYDSVSPKLTMSEIDAYFIQYRKSEEYKKSKTRKYKTGPENPLFGVPIKNDTKNKIKQTLIDKWSSGELKKNFTGDYIRKLQDNTLYEFFNVVTNEVVINRQSNVNFISKSSKANLIRGRSKKLKSGWTIRRTIDYPFC
jgi:hypothetical protein